MQFNYPHNNTCAGERKSRTAQFNKLNCSQFVSDLRKDAFIREIPTASDETLQFLCTISKIKGAESILEVGTAVGISGICLLQSNQNARLTTIERDENFYSEARNNFKNAGLSERVTLISGEAADKLKKLSGESYDLIFLDCAKVQYIKFLPELKRLLKRGGVIVADDILLYGWVTGEEETPKKRKMLVEHIREYITAVTEDSGLSTVILDTGDGIALSVKL